MKIFIREISGDKFFPVHALREALVTTSMEGIGNVLCAGHVYSVVQRL